MNSDDPNTHMVSATKQGGDMVNCLAVWDNLLVSGGDGGQLLLRFFYLNCNFAPQTTLQDHLIERKC